MAEPRDEFYVGYLPMPAGHLRFVRIAVPALLWGMVLCGVVIAVAARKPGDGVWDQGKPVNRVGVLRELPYPHLAPTMGDPAPVFLVEQGKRGTQERFKGRDGQLIRVTGWRLDRDGREILELIPGAEGAEVVSGLVPLMPPLRDHGVVTMRGEIVDYKCYLGAMKPGDGKTHKACAELCIAGGIPPMLVGFDENQGKTYTVLVDQEGGAGAFAGLIGERVQVTGTRQERGGLRVMRVGAGGVQRGD